MILKNKIFNRAKSPKFSRLPNIKFLEFNLEPDLEEIENLSKQVKTPTPNSNKSRASNYTPSSVYSQTPPNRSQIEKNKDVDDDQLLSHYLK